MQETFSYAFCVLEYTASLVPDHPELIFRTTAFSSTTEQQKDVH